MELALEHILKNLLFENQLYRETASLCWFTPQILGTAGIGPAKARAARPPLPGLSVSPRCRGPGSWAMLFQEAGTEVGQPGLKLVTMWGAGVAGSNLTHPVVIQTLRNSSCRNTGSGSVFSI